MTIKDVLSKLCPAITERIVQEFRCSERKLAGSSETLTEEQVTLIPRQPLVD